MVGGRVTLENNHRRFVFLFVLCIGRIALGGNVVGDGLRHFLLVHVLLLLTQATHRVHKTILDRRLHNKQWVLIVKVIFSFFFIAA